MIVKKHSSNGKIVLAVCDSELVGQVIEEGKKILDLSSEFYNGEEMSDETLLKEVTNVNSVNVVGKKSTKLLMDKGFIKNVNEINNVPYAYIMMD